MSSIVLNLDCFKVDKLEEDKVLVYQGATVVGMDRSNIAYVVTERGEIDRHSDKNCYYTRAPIVRVVMHSGAQVTFVIRNKLIKPEGQEANPTFHEASNNFNKNTNVFEAFPGCEQAAAKLVRDLTGFIQPLMQK